MFRRMTPFKVYERLPYGTQPDNQTEPYLEPLDR